MTTTDNYAAELRHLIDKQQQHVLGSDRFALQSSWFSSPHEAPIHVDPDTAADGDEPIEWIPIEAMQQLEEWFGALLLARGRVAWTAAADDNAAVEVETKPTFARVEVRSSTGTDGGGAVVCVLEDVSLCEDVPSLVRRALDAAPGLKLVDEEDVRLWIKLSTAGEYALVECDLPKAMLSATSEDSLEFAVPDEGEGEDGDQSSGRLGLFTLRGALGRRAADGDSLSLLLELRDADGHFTRPVTVAAAAADKKKKKTTTTGLRKLLSSSSSSSSSSPDAASSSNYHKKQSFSAKTAVKVGQRCDALCTAATGEGFGGRWLEAVVAEVNAQQQCRVHFLSLPARLDQLVSPAELLPPHTKVADWRQQLKVGDVIDLHTGALRPRVGGSLYLNVRSRLQATKTRWIPCTVRRIDRHGHHRDDPKVTLGVGLTNKYYGPEHLVQLRLDSETIAARYTHVTRPKSFTLGPQSTAGSPPAPGIVGLHNLGNTCYMNSVLQCLSHCSPVREYFSTVGGFEQDVNRRNPLGMGGQMAEAFAHVVQQLWSGEFQVVAPNRFKLALGQMNSQFQGFAQHDSQELLTQLLDCLHEDVNRVLKKPVTSPVECTGKPDAQVYDESWRAFQQRNDSRLVEEMYGMMKSHLLCPECNKEAVTFDAYANVSVPIPSLSLVRVDFVLVDRDLRATRCAAMLPKRAPASVLVDWIAQHLTAEGGGGVDREDVLVGEVIANKVGTFFHRALSQGSVLEEDDDELIQAQSTVRDLASSRSLFAWQLRAKTAEEEVEEPQVYPEVEAQWARFWQGLEALSSSSSSGGDAASTGVKEFVAHSFSPELGFPFPFAQTRLARGLAAAAAASARKPQPQQQQRQPQSKKSMLAASSSSLSASSSSSSSAASSPSPLAIALLLLTPQQVAAREACRMVEAEGYAAVPELLRECGGLPPVAELAPPAATTNAATTTNNASGSSLESGSSPSAPRKSVAPLRFFSRLFSSSPTATSTATVPPPSHLLLGNGNGNGSSTSRPCSSKCLKPATCSPTARLVVELNHFRGAAAAAAAGSHTSGGRRNSRMPSFVVIQADRTWGELHRDIALYLSDVVLRGFQGATAVGDGGDALFTLELDSVERAPFPLPHIPLLENIHPKGSSSGGTVNSLSVVVRWQHAAATDFVFDRRRGGGSSEEEEDQLADNPFRVGDAALGLGQVALHASVLAQDDDNGSSSSSAVTLDQCLEAFRTREQLGKEDAWYCDQCKQHQRAYKKMDLWNTPNVLVIHLKRFLYERTLGERVQREKINELVTFPLTGFDTRPMLAGGAEGGGVYDLFAVSNHMGGLGGGHYVAYVKSEGEDASSSWWLMNDGLVSKVTDESQVVSNAAYVLFYKKRPPQQQQQQQN